MDLLDDIEDISSGQYKGLGLKPGVQNAMSDDESEKEHTQGLLGMTFDINKVSSAFGQSHTDISILDRVRRRLYGGDHPVEQSSNGDTQLLIPLNNLQFSNSTLNSNADSASASKNATQVIQKLPQLEIDEDDFETAEPEKNIQHSENIDTQKIQEQTQDIEATQPILHYNQPLAELTKEEREKRIQEIIDRKKQERLEKEKQQQELEADITRDTLTDEENDLLDYPNDTVVSSTKQSEYSSKQLREAEEFINIQKRERVIQPEFNKKVLFTKEKLLLAFEEEEAFSDRDQNSDLGLIENIKSSPVTSPLKVTANKELVSSSESEIEEEVNVLDLIKKKPVRRYSNIIKNQRKNPIETYAHNLKRQIFSSPRKDSDEKDRLIQLDSDSEVELKSNKDGDRKNSNIPELSKDEVLAIKQKFSKKKLDQNCKIMSTLPKNVRNIMTTNPIQSNGVNFLTNLRKANIQQLQTHKFSNPDQEILDEMEKEEEIMGSLLEREFERTRNIRKREKLKERAAATLLGQNNESNEIDIIRDDEVEEVPDSEIDDNSDNESYYSSDENEEAYPNEIDNNEEDNQINKPKRKSKKMILSDGDEDDIEEGKVEVDTASKPVYDYESNSDRHDDSYMFGVNEPDHGDSLANEDHITTINSQSHKNGLDDEVSFTEMYRSGSDFQNKDSQSRSNVSASFSFSKNNEDDNLFQNLKSRTIENNPQTQRGNQTSFVLDEVKELPSFEDITQSANIASPTQVDEVLTRTLKVNETNDDNDEPINLSNVNRGRSSIRMNGILSQKHEEGKDDDDADDDEDPEIIKQRISEYERKIRQRELKVRRTRKELERKGIRNIVEGEAEESEDEWRGLGGIDDDLSDEQANSEDEKMIDNTFNIDLKNDEIREKFMDEYQIKDQKELEKLLDDIKNHRLSKRAGANGLDIELSDEEDLMLMKYRQQKLKEQNERLMANKRLNALSKDEKSKAFFASIQDSTSAIKIDDAEEEDEDVERKEIEKEGNDEIQTDNDDSNNELELEEPIKKTIKIEESFVQKKLSFLRNIDNDDEYEEIQRISRFQHGIGSVDDDIEDIQSLKTKSLLNLNCASSQNTLNEDNIKKRKSDVIDVEFGDDENDDEFMQPFKKPSIIQSFKSFNEQQGVQIKDGKGHFTGVTISKQYKVASGSKASISYLSKGKSQKYSIKSLKEKKIERSLANAKQNNNKLFNSVSFDK